MIKRLFKLSALSLLIKIFYTLINTTIALHVANILGASQYGVFAFFVAAFTLVGTISLGGLDIYCVKELSRRVSGEALGTFLRWCVKRVLIVSMISVGCFITLLLIDGTEEYLRVVKHHSYIILSIYFFALIRLFSGVIQGKGYILRAQIPQFIFHPLVFLAAIVVAWLLDALSTMSALSLYTASLAAALLVAVMLAPRVAVEARGVAYSCGSSEGGAWRRTSWAFFLLSICGVVNAQVGTLVAGIVIGPKEAGVFDVVNKAAALATFLLAAVNFPLGPTIARLYGMNRRRELQKVLTQSARWVLAFALIMTTGMALLGRTGLNMIGVDFVSGYPAFLILCLGQVINASAGSVGWLLNMSGHEQLVAKVMLVISALTVVAATFLGYAFGVTGIAVASALGLASWNVILVRHAVRKLGLDPTAFGLWASCLRAPPLAAASEAARD